MDVADGSQGLSGDQQDVVMDRQTSADNVVAKMGEKTGGAPASDAASDLADLRGDVASLRRQVHGLRSKLHGELAVLALRIEDNDRRSMQRRRLVRRCAMAAVAAVWLLLCPAAVIRMFDGPFVLPGVFLVCLTVIGGLSLVLLLLHNDADQQEHHDRYYNWFRLTARDGS